MDKARVVGGASGARKDRGLRLRPGLAKLEQWLVGFPCRVLIRYVLHGKQGNPSLPSDAF